MPGKNIEAVIVTRNDTLFTVCNQVFAESRVGATLARDQAGFWKALRENTTDAILLDAAYTQEILGLSAEDAVIGLAPRVIVVLADPAIPPEQVVRLLKLGAHYEVVKPLNPRLLAERLKALVGFSRARANTSKKKLTSASSALVMDYDRRSCSVKEVGSGPPSASKDIRLTKVEFQLLYFLLQRKGAVVTYDEFRERLWPTAVSAREIIHTLHQLVTNIRKKLGASPVKIENLRADGFRLV